MNHAATRNVLLIANDTIDGEALRDLVSASHHTDVLVVAPALNTRLRHWMSDEDGAREQAGARLTASVASLQAFGVSVAGRVGDADPLQAIADALTVYSADEVVIAAQPDRQANWLARDIVSRARGRFALPIGEVVVNDHSPAPVAASTLNVRRRAAAAHA